MSSLSDDVSLLIVLLAVVLLIADVALMAFAARRATRTLDDVDFQVDPLQSFKGGLRWPLPAHLGTTNTAPVLVGLDLFEWGIRIEARWPWLRPFVPLWCARYEEIVVAERARRGMRMSKRGSDGVRFRANLVGAPVIFWMSGSGMLLDSLEAHGVAVVRTSTVTRVWTNK
jgi:hypothetical protein